MCSVFPLSTLESVDSFWFLLNLEELKILDKLTMKSLIGRSRSHVILVLCILSLSGLFAGEADSGDDGAPMERAEAAALYSAIQGFVGNLWNGSDLYPDPCGWTPIQGVSCDIFDGFWYVTSLSIGPIHDNSLSCSPNVEFRPQLFELKHLRSLSFFKCFISPQQHLTALPSTDWSKLSGNLESLEFRSNPGLIGQIPNSFGNLSNLQSLVLLENGLTGEIPENIGQLTGLKRLVLAGNWFDGRIPDSFGRLSRLLILDLSRNLLSGTLPLAIEGLTSILKLDLSNNQLEGQLPNGIGLLRRLTLLDLRNNKFSGGLTKSLQDMYSLEELVLSSNSIGGDLKSVEWHKLHNLVILDLSNMGWFGEIPVSFVQLKRLRFLGLGDNNLTGSLSPKLASLPSIGALYVGGNNLTGELKFSQEFYRKMGRRFGAWSNPNLCYPGGLISMSDAPYGVKSCQQEVTLIEPDLNSKLGDGSLNQNSQFITSLGFSNFAVDGLLWWVSLVHLLLINFLFNLFQ